jgi:hypothetical protein
VIIDLDVAAAAPPTMVTLTPSELIGAPKPE